MAERNGSNGDALSPAAAQQTGLKPTQAVHRQFLNEVTELWARHCRPDEIRAIMRKERGLSRHATDRYIRAARDRVVKASQIPIEQLVARSYATYARIVRAPLEGKGSATNSERIAAQRAIDDLFSLQKARKVALTTTEGEDVLQSLVARMTPEELNAADMIGRLVEEAERGETLKLEGKGDADPN